MAHRFEKQGGCRWTQWVNGIGRFVAFFGVAVFLNILVGACPPARGG